MAFRHHRFLLLSRLLLVMVMMLLRNGDDVVWARSIIIVNELKEVASLCCLSSKEMDQYLPAPGSAEDTKEKRKETVNKAYAHAKHYKVRPTEEKNEGSIPSGSEEDKRKNEGSILVDEGDKSLAIGCVFWVKLPEEKSWRHQPVMVYDINDQRFTGKDDVKWIIGKQGLSLYPDPTPLIFWQNASTAQSLPSKLPSEVKFLKSYPSDSVNAVSPSKNLKSMRHHSASPTLSSPFNPLSAPVNPSMKSSTSSLTSSPPVQSISHTPAYYHYRSPQIGSGFTPPSLISSADSPYSQYNFPHPSPNQIHHQQQYLPSYFPQHSSSHDQRPASMPYTDQTQVPQFYAAPFQNPHLTGSSNDNHLYYNRNKPPITTYDPNHGQEDEQAPQQQLADLFRRNAGWHPNEHHYGQP